MIFDLPMFTLIHTVLSLVGIIAGLIVVGGLMAGHRFGGWTAAFLFTTVLTNVTGFFFPFSKVLPSHIVGVISLIVLAVAIAARYWKHLAGAWRTAFVVTSVLALYLNVFVLFVQMFQKIPGMRVLAPTQSEPVFVATQGLVLVLFAGIGWAALRGFRTSGQ